MTYIFDNIDNELNKLFKELPAIVQDLINKEFSYRDYINRYSSIKGTYTISIEKVKTEL